MADIAVLADGLVFPEGPVFDKSGDLWFVELQRKNKTFATKQFLPQRTQNDAEENKRFKIFSHTKPQRHKVQPNKMLKMFFTLHPSQFIFSSASSAVKIICFLFERY